MNRKIFLMIGAISFICVMSVLNNILLIQDKKQYVSQDIFRERINEKD